MIKKNILKTFTISVIFCAALFTGCDLFFNSKKQDNSANDYSSNNPESNIEEHEFEIEIALNPQMVEHGAIPSGNNRLQSRSTTIVPDITTIDSLVITATRKKDGETRYIEDFGHLLHSEDGSSYFYVFIVDVDQNEYLNHGRNSFAEVVHIQRHRL